MLSLSRQPSMSLPSERAASQDVPLHGVVNISRRWIAQPDSSHGNGNVRALAPSFGAAPPIFQLIEGAGNIPVDEHVCDLQQASECAS